MHRPVCRPGPYPRLPSHWRQDAHVAGFTRPVLAALAQPHVAGAAVAAGGLVRDSARLTALLQASLAGLAPPPRRRHQLGGPAVTSSAPPEHSLRPAAFSCAFVGFDAAPASADALAAAGLRIGYETPYPLSALLSADALDQYNAVFGQLLRVRRVLAMAEALSVDAAATERLLGRALRFVGPAVPAPIAATLAGLLRDLQARRHALLLFLQSLAGLLSRGVLSAPWAALQGRLAAVQSFEGLQAAHAAYLRACLGACFLLESQVCAWAKGGGGGSMATRLLVDIYVWVSALTF